MHCDFIVNELLTQDLPNDIVKDLHFLQNVLPFVQIWFNDSTRRYYDLIIENMKKLDLKKLAHKRKIFTRNQKSLDALVRVNTECARHCDITICLLKNKCCTRWFLTIITMIIIII